MAEKGFGVKEVNLIGASGTPTIISPNNLNLNAVNVAISTNATIGGTLAVTGNVSVGGTLTYEDVTNIDSVGIITARSGVDVDDFVTVGSNIQLGNAGVVTATTFSGSGASLTSIPAGQLTGTVADARISTLTASKLSGALPAISGANLTNLPATDPTNSDVQVAYTVTANGASAYRFAGNGVVSTADNPDLYLIRGQKYRFINNSGGSHPFQIREASGGTAYSTGVTNNGAASGNIDFAPTYDSPAQLVYQCTSHGSMVGDIYLRDAAGGNTNVGVTTFNAGINVNGGETFISGDTNPCLSVNRGSANTTNINIKYNGSTRSQLSAASNGFEISAVGSTAPIQFFANGTEKVRIPAATWGLLVTSLSSTGNTGGYQTEGVSLRTGGDSTFVRTGNPAVTMTRKSDAGRVLDFYSGTTFAGGIYVNGSASVAFNTSDYRLKTDVNSITDGIDKVKQLNPVYFKWKDTGDTINTQNGFIAHEVQSVIPTIVFGEKDATIDEKGQGYQGLNYAGFTPTAIAAIKELIAKVETLESKVAALEGS